MDRPRRFPGLVVACVLALALGACSLLPERTAPGTPRAEIEQRMGKPTAVHALPEGQRLQYSGQPSGHFVYNFDLDAQGRLRSARQVMDEADLLQQIQVNRWTREDVLRHMGRPALVERVARFDGEVWTYRYQNGGWPRLFHVHLDPAGVVRQLMMFDEIPPPSHRE